MINRNENKPLLSDKHASAMLQALKTVKLFCGVGNNAAISVMLHALGVLSGRCVNKDGDRQLPYYRYRHQVKAAYINAQTALKDFERRLKFDVYFDPSKMNDEERKRYGDISREDYFYLWKGMGAKMYQDSKPLLSSLWNKYRLSLERHGIKEADKVAWAVTAHCCLEIADKIYEASVKDCQAQGILSSAVDKAFGMFCIKPVADAWCHALKLTDPHTGYYTLSADEDRNIELGILQIYEKWMSPAAILESTVFGIVEQEDSFRTPGEAKKEAKEWHTIWDRYESFLDSV